MVEAQQESFAMEMTGLPEQIDREFVNTLITRRALILFW